MAIEEKVGFCTLCRSRCGTVNVIEEGRLIAVKPNPAHPTGKALCPKGRAAPEIAHSPRRLTTPMRRTAPKGAADPGFVAITWDEALAEIAERLERCRRENGAESVAFACTSPSSSSMSDASDWVHRFVRGFGSPNFCISTEICNWHKDYAHAFTFGCATPPADYRNADLILLWGHNPANVWLAQAEAIAAGRAKGALLAVIDPRRAGSARDADLWLRVRPGTDGALAMGLARQLIERETFDRDFVARWTNAAYLVREGDGHFVRGADLGWPNAEAYVVWDDMAEGPVDASRSTAPALRGAHRMGTLTARTAFDHYIEAVDPYDAATVERITGIPAAQVDALAIAMGRAHAICYHAWTGVGQHTNATQTERAIATLYALTGSFDRAGGNVRMPALPAPSLHSMDMIPPEVRAKALGLAQRPLGPPAFGWITSSDLYDAILERKPYAVRALFGFGANLLVSHPDPERGREALRELEFQVHCDLFLNPTAEYADIVLPVSTAWEYEALRVGFEISPEAQELVQLRQPMVPRLGETRSDMWIVFQLARRLGMGELFFDGDIESGFRHLLAPLAPFGVSLETLRAKPEGMRVPLEHRERKYRETGFSTQTGRAELYSELLVRHGYPPVPHFTPPSERPSAEFPLVLFSTNSGYFCHSQHRGIASLRRRRPEPMAEIHPDLGRAHGIEEGDSMLVRTHLGAIRVRAAFSEALATDVVACDYGWWQSAPDLGLPGYLPTAEMPVGGNFNAIIDARVRDPVSGALPLRSARCTIGRARPRAWRGWRRFVVRDRTHEAEDVVSLALVPADGGALEPFQPGQFITLQMGGASRSYSLIGAATASPDAYRIAVRRVDGGAASRIVLDDLRAGDLIDVAAPSGRFVIPTRNEFPVVLIAGGIGITPFLSYLETLIGHGTEPQVTLHYSCRNAASRPFAARLAALASHLPNLTVIHHLSRPDAGDAGNERARGRFSVDDIDASRLRARARFYICASDAMMEAAVTGLRARGVPAFEIFRERFRSPEPPHLHGMVERRVHFSRTGRTLTWTPTSGPILTWAEGQGLALPGGCRVGQCESCALRVVSGTVQHLVEAPELDDGQCLACQAVPTSDLVIDA